MHNIFSYLGTLISQHPFHQVQGIFKYTRSSLIQRLLIILAALFGVLGLVSCAPAQATLVNVPVTLAVDGKQINLEVTVGSTVQSAIQQAGVALNNLDRVEPPGYTVLTGNTTIQITRVREAFTIKETVIPFERQTIHNESLPEGKTLLVQQGVNGVEQTTYRQVFENEKETSNTVFKSEVLEEPQPEVMMVGVQKPFTPVPIPGKLAYLSAGNAWLMEQTTGSRRPVVTTGDLDGEVFALSPKGDWLLFTRSDKSSNLDSTEQARINSLWAVDLTEENSKPINLKVYNVKSHAAWVPDKGLTITYSTVEPRSVAPGWQANNDLHMLSFTSTGATVKQETILDTNMGGLYGWWGTNFAWSPDGALLAYSRPDEVGLVDLENKALVPLVAILPFKTGSSWAWVPGVEWSPDHNVLFLVTHANKAGLDNQETSPLFDLAGLPFGEKPFETNGPLISLIPQAGMFAYPVPMPTMQPDGYKVAFLQAIFPEQSDKRYRLAIMDRDGSNRQVIFPAEDRQGLEAQRVIWSPKVFDNNHAWLAVINQGNLWLVDSENGEAQAITGDGLISRIDWK